MIKNKIYILLFIKMIFPQEVIGDGLSSEDLINFLQENYTTNSVLSYNAARDAMYGQIYNDNGNLSCVYTQYTINNVPTSNPRPTVTDGGMNCEHVWPQSMYNGSSPMKSDMHHMKPCKSNVNSARGNKPFNEVLDSQTSHWYWLSNDLSSPPSNNINEYSESGSSAFEPREDMKGDIARIMYYFYTIYYNVADNNFFEEQKDILYEWHINDPVSDEELDITWEIASYQNNIPNPFIIDNSLIYRAYFYNPSLPGDVNIDNIVNVVDVVFMVSIIMDNVEIDSNQFANADLDGNLLINVADIVALVNIILS